MKLRDTTKEEKELHTVNLTKIRFERDELKKAYEAGKVSKSAAKRKMAELHNRINNYLEENNLEIFMNYLYVRGGGRMKCPQCESENISLANVKGRDFLYGKISVTIKEDLELLTCSDCGAIVLRNDEEENKFQSLIKSAVVTPPMIKGKNFRYQVVKMGSTYQVRFKKLIGWQWLTEVNRKNKIVVASYFTQEEAIKAAETQVKFLNSLEYSAPKEFVVYDSNEIRRVKK